MFSTAALRARITVPKVVTALVLLAAAWFLADFSWQTQVVGLVADDAIYMLLVDFFSPWSQALRESAGFISQHSTFPPLYPLLLAMLGTESGDILYAHMLSTLIEVAALGLVIRYFATTRLPFALVMTAALLFFLLPITLLQHVELLSEPLYLAITMAALIYYEELPGERDVRKVCIIGILVSLAILTRTAGIALLVAFLFWQAVGTKNNRSLLAVALAVVPYLIWEVIKARIYVGPWTYTSLLAEAYPLNDIPGLIHKLAIDANNMWIGWRQYIDIGMEPSSLPAALLLAVLALPVWFARLIERRLDAVYLLLYAGMILIWPFPDHTARFLYPVMPMLFFYCILTLQKYAKLQWRNTAVGTLLALIFLGAAPSSGQILGKAFAKNSDMLGNFGKSRMLYGRQSPMTVIDRNAWLVGQLTHAMQESAQLVPPGACVYTMHYEWYMYYARRYARPVTGYDLERLNKGGKLDCPYMFINWSNTHSHVRPGYPAQDLNRRYRVLHQYRTVHPQIGRGRDPILAELVQFVPDQP